ncbi:hypothetical protein Gbem_3736 [Citrifermentans bemidjiense Bem]|uniref:Uncharacterized protein n=1 Tax=Citrifermentans bemidjiense (strain ATCC BAA-1014 / DSM 16622 / JCM 12645 / Bem) TaxID=404380 RepID=B5EDV0_CITBB|nr:hypothetical protein [Citrifermentans bemidjiense]ACH40728.1 hypothetical protein Gbem_3736 [Citrifermentans bemidjiense Bem]
MPRKSILLFSCEPGGAEILIPVIRLLHAEPAYRVVVLSYGLGAQRFAARGVDFIEIPPVQKNDNAVLDSHRPDFLITSATSLPERDMSEKNLWRNARARGVPSLALVDQWQNYAVRFSGPGEGERLAYLPDFINCIDEVGAVEMIREGFQPGMLVRFGHPSLSQLRRQARNLQREEIRRRLGIPATQQVALFVSEAIREHYGRSRGYDQYDSLGLFLDLVADSGTGIKPVIKLHPKDEASLFDPMLRSRNLQPLMIANELSSLECIALADRVYGMTSIMLIEAYLLGKPVLSLQPGLAVEDPLVLSRHGMVPRLGTPEQAMTAATETPPLLSLKVEFEIDRFLQFIRDVVTNAKGKSHYAA